MLDERPISLMQWLSPLSCTVLRCTLFWMVKLELPGRRFS
jgi:hypothetical protein